MTHCEAILAYIQEHGSITPLEALTHCACMRLSARIYDLRAMGYDIKTEIVTVKNRYGQKVRVSRYTLNG